MIETFFEMEKRFEKHLRSVRTGQGISRGLFAEHLSQGHSSPSVTRLYL